MTDCDTIVLALTVVIKVVRVEEEMWKLVCGFVYLGFPTLAQRLARLNF